MSWETVLHIVAAIYLVAITSSLALGLMEWHHYLKARVHVDRLLASAGYRRSKTLSLTCLSVVMTAQILAVGGAAGALMIFYPGVWQLLGSSLFLFGIGFMILLVSIECLVEEKPAYGEQPGSVA